jgi:hypothetical protein
VVKPLIVEGEFGNGGRLLLVVVVERRWLILLVRVNYFGASCCFWGCHSAATSMEEWALLLEDGLRRRCVGNYWCTLLLVLPQINCGGGGDGACCSGVRISVGPDQTHMVPLLLAELGCCLWWKGSRLLIRWGWRNRKRWRGLLTEKRKKKQRVWCLLVVIRVKAEVWWLGDGIFGSAHAPLSAA